MNENRTVLVWGKSQGVCVHRESKCVGSAMGDDMGVSIRCEDRTSGTAVNRWREAATYKGGLNNAPAPIASSAPNRNAAASGRTDGSARWTYSPTSSAHWADDLGRRRFRKLRRSAAW